MKPAGVVLLALLPLPGSPVDTGPLRVSANHRFLVQADGTPFFWLADTAWELFHRTTREQAEMYLENRRQKHFTVIQAVVLAELDGLDDPNSYGEHPLIGNDPTKANDAYFRYVDWVIQTAAGKGLIVALLPTWGNKVVRGSWEKTAPIIFNTDNARVYGRWIGKRYRDTPNLVWVLGGDRNPDGVEGIWREMARGLREGDGGRHLITFHPNGQSSSSQRLHNEDWLDFNMIQSGHAAKDHANYEYVDRDYRLSPVKPTVDGESRYEDHPVNWQPEKNGWFDEIDIRQSAYWATFAGAFGHTYGCHPIWQMLAPGRKPVGYARHNWTEVLDLPGASQLQYLRALMESRPFLSRVPDQSLIVDNPERGPDHAQATRGDGYAFVYIPSGRPMKVRLGQISGKALKTWWYDPRTGAAKAIATFANAGEKDFSPPGSPSRGNDWVLVLDDSALKFSIPGQGTRKVDRMQAREVGRTKQGAVKRRRALFFRVISSVKPYEVV